MTSGHRPPSSPRGFSGFCLMAQVPPGHKSVPSVLSVKSVVKEEKLSVVELNCSSGYLMVRKGSWRVIICI